MKEEVKTELFVVNVSHFDKKANDLYSHSFIVSNIQDAKNIYEREISKIEEYVRLNSLEHNSYHDNVEDEDGIDWMFELYSKDKIFSVNLTMKEVK